MFSTSPLFSTNIAITPPQAEKDNDEPYCCLSDFVAPKGSGVGDYIGMFACTAGLGLDDVILKFKEVGCSWGRG